MRGKLICLISVLVMLVACTSYGLVLDDFEGAIIQDAWRVNDWDSPPGALSVSTVGVTSGSQSMRIDAPRAGWTIACLLTLDHSENPILGDPAENLAAYLASDTLEMDVTFDPADWIDDGAGGAWANVAIVINSQNGGWQDQGAPDVDPLYPDFPGTFDPVVFTDVNTRHLVWDISDTHDALANGGGDWFEIFVIMNSGGYPNGGAIYIDNVRLGSEEATAAGPKIIYVTSVKDQDADGMQDDLSWVEWLEAEGYTVDARPGNWIDPLDADKIAELEAADLIIASRGMSTGEYDGDETAKWNAITTPIICTNAWMIRSNRWVWMNSTSANKDAGSPVMQVLEAGHPIFAGVQTDADGLVDALDPTVASGHTSFLTDILDVGNGTLLAKAVPGVYDTAWIVEWPAGVEYYDGAGQVTGGPRLLFMAGTQDDPYLAPNGNTSPVGVFNLNEAGQQILRNAIKYLLGAKNIVLVSFHEADDVVHEGAAGAGFTEAPDKGYSDLLSDAGYNVTRYVTTSAPDPNVLNAADLVIISRSIGSGDYSGDGATAWNSISAPMIVMSGYTLRTSRMGYTTGTTMVDTIGDISLVVADPTHPIFDGISITDGVMDNPYAGIITYPTDGVTVARGISVNTDPANEDGTVLATVATADDPTVGGIIIGEWPAGSTMSHSGGAETDILPAPRLAFLTGSREADGVDSRTAGIMDLYPDGQQMLLNAVAYMTAEPIGPTHSYTFEDGTASDGVGNADGVLVGGAEVIGGALVTTAQDQWMEMPGDVIDVNSYSAVTIEAFYKPTAGANTSWSMLAYFGDSVDGYGSNGFFMTSARGDDKSRAAISVGDIASPWASETGADGPEYDDGLDHYMASTIDDTQITLYIDGELIAATELSETNKLSGVSNNYAYLAKGGYDGDPEWIGEIEEFNMYNVALSADEIAANYAAGPVKVGPQPIDPGTEGLVVYYPLDSAGRGVTKDASGNGLDGTIVGDPVFVEDAIVGNALEFSGDDYVDCATTEDLANWTISVWVKSPMAPVSDGGQSGPIHREANYQMNWNHGGAGWAGAVGLSAGGWHAASLGDLEADTWYHLAGTYDGETLKAYKNGELITANEDPSGPAASESNSLKLGKHARDAYFFTGIIDEAMVYSRALSDLEIAYLAGL